MLRERVGDLKDVEIRVLTLLLDLPDHDPVDLPEGRERDSRHARSDAEPHGAARPRGDRRHRDRRRHAHVARRDSRALARASGDRRASRRDAGADAVARPRFSTDPPACSRSIRRPQDIESYKRARAPGGAGRGRAPPPRRPRGGDDGRRAHHAARERRPSRRGRARGDAAARRASG